MSRGMVLPNHLTFVHKQGAC